jgi:hypothetical protein
MRTNAAAHPWRTSLAWSAVFRAAGLSIFGLIAWLWLFSAAGPAWRAVSLVAAQALAALAGVAWYLPRARAERQWRAALDQYGEQEQAKRSGAGRARCPRPRAHRDGRAAQANRDGVLPGRAGRPDPPRKFNDGELTWCADLGPRCAVRACDSHSVALARRPEQVDASCIPINGCADIQEHPESGIAGA